MPMPASTVALADLPVGASARVIALQSAIDDSYAARLASLGLVPGTLLTVQRKAPFGDPVEVRVRGFSLALRPSETRCLVLQRIAP